MLFSEPKIPQSREVPHARGRSHVSVLFSEPKIPQLRITPPAVFTGCAVSVLFSEPKIPQFTILQRDLYGDMRFSALQRAENSSILTASPKRETSSAFQCSSASRKFLNRASRGRPTRRVRFQCSSASRKFLNREQREEREDAGNRFSALQRAENSSMYSMCCARPQAFAFQCSSASRKFLNRPMRGTCTECRKRVSVLFSEPKIPQLHWFARFRVW